MSENPSSLKPGERIRSLRLRLNQTQEQFSQALGISKSYLSALERGNRPLSRKIMNQIHSRFGLSYDYLLDGRQPSPIPKQNTVREPEGYHVRRDLSLILGSCSPEEAAECYDLIHTYLNYARSKNSKNTSESQEQ